MAEQSGPSELPLVEVLIRQREAWQGGQQPDVEVLLEQYPHLASSADAVLDLIYGEVVLREQAGQTPALEDYIRRFPNLASELRLQFEVDQALSAEEMVAQLGSTHPHARSALPGAIPPLEDCDLLDELGRGAMGVVYRGWQRSARRVVAVKLLDSDMPAGRARNEIRAATRLSHPGLVQIFEVKEHEGRTALVLEFVAGGNLAEKLSGRPIDPREAARLVEALAWTMAHAHSRGVIHRDLKPSNVLLAGEPETPLAQCAPKISDFGLAKLIETGGVSLTRTSDILGTPSYMAPEQTGTPGAQVGPACDIWALGAILYDCLTGRPPFLGQTVLDTLDQLRHREPVPPSRLQQRIPRDLDIICLKCLHKDPARRPASARVLAEDLGRFLAGEPIQSRSVGLAERAWKWAKRRPGNAVLVMVTLAALIFLVTGVVVATEVFRQQRDIAVRQAEELDRQLQRTRQLLYTAQLLRAGSIRESDPAEGLRLLEDPRACPPDLRCFSWGVLQSLCKRYREALPGHLAPVSTLAVGPRDLVASGDTTGVILIWAPQEKQPRRLVGHVGKVNGLAFSPEGALLASCGEDGQITLWDLSASIRTSGFSVGLASRSGAEGKPRAHALAWLPDGRSLAVLLGEGPAGSGRLSLWDPRTGRSRRIFREAVSPLSGLAVSPDGHLLACAGPDQVVRLWDTRTGKLHNQATAHAATVTCLAFAPDGGTLVSASVDGAIRIWDLAQERLRDSFETTIGPITGLAYHPRDPVLAVVSRGSAEGRPEGPEAGAELQVWDLAMRRGSDPVQAHPGGLARIAFSTDGRTLITGGADALVKRWDHPGRREQVSLRGFSASPGSIALAGAGRILAWISRESTVGEEITAYDLERGAPLGQFRGHGKPLLCLALNHEGTLLAAGTGRPDEPGEVLCWEVRTGRLVQALTAHQGGVAAMAFLPAGQGLVCAGRDGAVSLWDPVHGTRRWQSPLTSNALRHLAVSRDGSWLALGSETGLWVLDAAEGKVATKQEVPVLALALSSDGSLLARAGPNGALSLGPREHPEKSESLSTGIKMIACLAFSVDGQTLAVAGENPGVKLLGISDGQERASLPGHRGGACFADFTEDGSTLITASLSRSARIWYRGNP